MQKIQMIRQWSITHVTRTLKAMPRVNLNTSAPQMDCGLTNPNPDEGQRGWKVGGGVIE